jgi:hypothetical protein
LKDYKLICFNGKVKCSFTCSNRNKPGGLYGNFYDMDWNPMPFVRHYPRNPVEIAKPTCFDEMIRIAEVLSRDIPLVRIDFYQVQGRPYVGEITFYPGSGMEEFTPEEWDFTLGSWIELPEKKNGSRKAKDGNVHEQDAPLRKRPVETGCVSQQSRAFGLSSRQEPRAPRLSRGAEAKAEPGRSEDL